MAIPSEGEICAPLLQVIAEAGGELRVRDAIAQVERHFPGLTTADKKVAGASGMLTWPNRVQWARQLLVANGYLHRQPRGTWRITPQGLEYLHSNLQSRGQASKCLSRPKSRTD